MMRMVFPWPQARRFDLPVDMTANVYQNGELVLTVPMEGFGPELPEKWAHRPVTEMDSTVGIALPGEWVREGLQIGVASAGGEMRYPVEVDSLLPLELVVVAVVVRGDSASVPAIAEMVRRGPGHPLLAGLRMLPVGELTVSAGPPLITNSSSMNAVLHELNQLHKRSGDNRYWLGLMPEGYEFDFNGAAFLNGKVSVSHPDAGTIAHELGHNFGLSHAPCGDPRGPDPFWKLERDEWGVDHLNGRIVKLGEWAHAHRRPDLMSYCQSSAPPRRWITSYSFNRAFAFRRALAQDGGAHAYIDAGRVILCPLAHTDHPTRKSHQGGQF